MTNDAFRSRYGPCALVAGSAVGLGAEYARQIAALGLDLVLLDRDAEPLAATASAARSLGVEVEALVVDLARPDLVEAIGPAIEKREIGLLVYNAAVGTVAPFLETTTAHIESMIDVNCRGPVHLAHALAPAMVARGRGGIIVMSSMSGNFGSTQLAVYAATKAFNLVFADALWAELRGRGVDVLAVQPGSTRTPGWLTSQPADGEGALPAMEPPDVVREVMAALGKGPCMIPGEANRQSAAILAGMPRHQAIELMSSITEKLVRNDRP
jgi:uncharacterized protein